MFVSGVSFYQQLRADGFSRKDIQTSLNTGQIERVARGWYASKTADELVVRALRLGGRLGCLSGLMIHGVWVPRTDALHVVSGIGQPGPQSAGVLGHRYDRRLPAGPIWPIEDCLAQAVDRHGGETALIVVESALNLELVSRAFAASLLSDLGQEGQRLRTRMRMAESGSETRVRLFFSSRGIKVTPQVYLPGIGRIDMLVGKKLIVECDSAAHHTDLQDHEEDRRRELVACRLGFDTLRLSYRQIWQEWDQTQESLLEIIRDQRHLRSAGRHLKLRT